LTSEKICNFAGKTLLCRELANGIRLGPVSGHQLPASLSIFFAFIIAFNSISTIDNFFLP
ncbi:MAG: hypothetical protein K2F70_02340, partial [Muribaculaceae bacterium]|nr:hypothetical protein [Muribaculaceae bacterium]